MNLFITEILRRKKKKLDFCGDSSSHTISNMKTKTLFLTLILFFSTFSQAGLLLTYHKLALKDLDQMNEIVSSKIKESKKSYAGKTVPLKEALQAVLSRPDEDNMVEKVLAPLKIELESHNAWEKSLKELTIEAMNSLKNSKNFKIDVQVTYQIFLENLLAQLKPDLGKGGFEVKLVEKIRDAKLEINKEAQKERKLRMMKSTISPSDVAELLLTATKVESSQPVTTSDGKVDNPEKNETPESK